jgi:hypothetical protein
MKKPAFEVRPDYAGSLFFAVRGQGSAKASVTQTARFKALPALLRAAPCATDRSRDLPTFPPTKWEHAMECASGQRDAVLPRPGLSVLHAACHRKWSCENEFKFLSIL